MKKPLVIGIVAVLAIGIGGYAGVQYWSQMKAHAVIEDALAQVRASGAKATLGASAVSLKDRSLTLSDLKVTSADGAVSLAIAQLAARGVGTPQDGRITADAVALEGVTLTRTDATDGTRVVESLPHVAIAGYTGPLVVTPTAGAVDDAVAASPVVIALRQLAAVDATRIDVPHAVTRITPGSLVRTRGLAQASELTLDGITATDVRAGRIARLSVARFATQAQPADTAAAPRADGAASGPGDAQEADGGSSLPRAEAVAILARDIDLTPLLAASGGGVLRPVLGALETGAFSIQQEEDIRSEGSGLRLTGLAVRPAVLTPARLAALAALSADEPPADAAPLLADATALLQGIAFTAFEVRDLRTIEPVGGGRAALFALGPLADGILAELRFDSVEGDSDGRAVKFGRIALTGLNLPRLISLAHSPDPTQPDVALAGFSALTGVSANDIELPVDAGDDAPAEPIRVGRASLTWGDLSGLLPTRIRFELTDVSGPINPDDGEPFNTLAAAGLKRATFSLALGATYDAATQSLAIAPAQVEVKDAFRTAFSARVDNLPAAALASEDTLAAALPGLTLGPLSLSVTDLGLANLMLQRLAEAEGVSVDDYRAQMLEVLNQGIAAVAPGAPEAAAVAEAIAQFIRDPRTLVLTATPKGRVPLLAFINSDDPAVPLQLFTFGAVNTP
ncbi:hypothetical protein V5F53_04405 [Xanthobacter sp. V4C-4]|uniref:hypothetical protein n=1 Tax=Xanthobacter cornucopiae TaxID=3119924 RepID=UPI00372C1B68